MKTFKSNMQYFRLVQNRNTEMLMKNHQLSYESVNTIEECDMPKKLSGEHRLYDKDKFNFWPVGKKSKDA